MPLNNNVFHSASGLSTIKRHFPSRAPEHSRISSALPYPDGQSMVTWATSSDWLRTIDTFKSLSNDDALFALSVKDHTDGERRRLRPLPELRGPILTRLLGMGRYDWREPNPPPEFAIRCLRYSAALGSELLGRIEGWEDSVQVVTHTAQFARERVCHLEEMNELLTKTVASQVRLLWGV